MSSRKPPHGKIIEGVRLGEPQKIINIHKKKKNRNIRTISTVCSFFKVSIYLNKTLSGCLRELKNKAKVQSGNPESG